MRRLLTGSRDVSGLTGQTLGPFESGGRCRDYMTYAANINLSQFIIGKYMSRKLFLLCFYASCVRDSLCVRELFYFQRKTCIICDSNQIYID